MEENSFKSGFVSILGKPNVGKSSLMNAILGERLSIITAKAQTTRHRIFGIYNGKNHQIVFSDTPGIIDSNYLLQEKMMNFVKSSLIDADVVLLVIELKQKYEPTEVIDFLKNAKIPVLVILNKIDLAKGSQVKDKIDYWKEYLPDFPFIEVSAKEKTNLDTCLNAILELLPEHPPYFLDDALSDRSQRFFASEIIREKIFLNYQQEIPYSCEVVIEEFKEEDNIIRILANIYVERDSQKGIIIGNKGESLKKVGTQSRLEMESFFEKKIFLATHVKVEKDWRRNQKSLKRFGYIE